MCLLFDSVVKSVFYVNTSVLDVSVASEIGTFSHFLQVDVLDDTVEPYVMRVSGLLFISFSAVSWIEDQTKLLPSDGICWHNLLNLMISVASCLIEMS